MRVAFFLICFQISAWAVSPESLLGTWVNPDPAGGIVKIVISPSANGISVQGFGSCHPNPCEWTAVPGVVYADDVRSNSAVAFSAVFPTRFEKKLVVGRLQGQVLEVEIFTEFTERTARSNFRLTAKLTR